MSARNERPAFEICKSDFVGRDHARARAAFDGHVANGHARFHGERANGIASVFENVAVAAGDAHFSDDGEDDVFRREAAAEFSFHFDARGFRFELREALRGEHVFNFTGTDAEGERTHRAVRGGVAVSANDSEPRLRDAQFGSDDVHDALIAAVHVEQADASFAAIFGEGFELSGGVGVEHRQITIFCGDGVVHHGESQFRAANFAACGFESRERLWRSAFVDQVAIDVNQRGLARDFAHDVRVPDFFVKGQRGHEFVFDALLFARRGAMGTRCELGRETRETGAALRENWVEVRVRRVRKSAPKLSIRNSFVLYFLGLSAISNFTGWRLEEARAGEVDGAESAYLSRLELGPVLCFV